MSKEVDAMFEAHMYLAAEGQRDLLKKSRFPKPTAAQLPLPPRTPQLRLDLIQSEIPFLASQLSC